jgi:pimeloyl-ACP methyl ester carboxylesterase
MLSSMYKVIKKKQPVSLTGIARHLGLWATYQGGDVILQNPKNVHKETMDNEIAIYCIHGICDRASAFTLVAERIKNHLPDEISSVHLVTFNHRWRGKNIEFFAEQLKNKIQENNHKNIILLGHSRGGLIAAYFAEYLAAAATVNVHAVITISTPFAGSDYAIRPITWISSSVDEMRINSNFLKNLNDKIKDSSLKYYYFAAQNDWLVPPKSSCIKECKDQMKTLDRHGHLSIMSSHRLVEDIRTCLVESIQHQRAPVMAENITDLQPEVLV